MPHPVAVLLVAVIALLIIAAVAWRLKRRAASLALLVVGVAAASLPAWPAVQQYCPALSIYSQPPHTAPGIPSTPVASTTPAAAAASAPAWDLTGRMPADHPDPSAPRNGPHFACHQDYAR